MRSHCQRSGFTLIELLVAIAIIGVLVAILLPSVQQARAAARRVHCQNNLKQIALATTNFHDVEQAFPPARLILERVRPNPQPAREQGLDEPSWFVRIMPYLEQASLFDEWDLYLPYGEHAPEIRAQAISTYLCPDRLSASAAFAPDSTIIRPAACGCPGTLNFVPGGAVTSYGGNHGDLSPGAVGSSTDYYWGGNGTGVIISSRPRTDGNDNMGRDWIDRIRMRDLVDGSSCTLLAGEMHVPRENTFVTPWNGPAYYGRHTTNFARLGGPGVPLAHSPDDPRANFYSFGSAHSGVVPFAMADGRVELIATSVSTTVLGHLTHRNDGHAAGY